MYIYSTLCLTNESHYMANLLWEKLPSEWLFEKYEKEPDKVTLSLQNTKMLIK